MPTSPATSDDPRFQPVRTAYEPSLWADSSLRFGLVVLDTDHASERELRRMLPESGEIFVSRMRHGGDCDLAHLTAMGDQFAIAASLLLPGTALDGIAFSCTSGTAAIGIDAVRRAVEPYHPGTPVISPITAARAAFDELGVTRVAVLTPYVDEVNRMLVQHIEDEGIGVTVLANFGLHTDAEIASVPAEAVAAAAREMDRAGAEGLFISCTGLRVGRIIEPLEAELGLPVVTSNQAMAWDLLRQAGHAQPVEGYGELMRRLGNKEGTANGRE
ncbi:MAG: aspartate/glutamate racemase family protein [Halofilum sp. (in: g-proteobacteria)]|nr:aspartate/glutamate racemase family protein [Halofilum sp. (in: g-proteobacteria)]